MTRAIVTGSNGFIGGYIAEKLQKEGFYVIGLDVSDSSGKYCNQYIKCDISNTSLVDDNIISVCNNIDVIIHAAAAINMNSYDSRLISVNLSGTLNLLKFANIVKCRNIIYISGVPVIGKPLIQPITTTIKENPSSLYHITKLAGEHVFNLPEAKDITSCILRLPSPIGVNMPKTFLYTLIDKALKNEDIMLYGKGTRKQNYIDVRDISDAVLKSINYKARGCYNIAADAPISNFELAQMCINILNSSSKILYSDLPDSSDNDVWDIDTAPAKKDFQFQAKYSINETILWISNNL